MKNYISSPFLHFLFYSILSSVLFFNVFLYYFHRLGERGRRRRKRKERLYVRSENNLLELSYKLMIYIYI